MKTQERYRVIRNFLFIGVFLFLSFTIHAANAPVVSFGSACNAVVGQTITVPVVVKNFNNISGFTLAVDYDYSKLHCEIASSNYNSSLGGTCNIGEINLGNGFRRLKISWYKDGATGITLTNGSAVANYVFTYVSGPADLNWFDNGPSCVFTDPNATVLNDSPTSSYYINGLVSSSCSILPTITANGPTSFCEGGSVELTASAGSAYKWSPGGATTKSITVSTSGSYTVEVTDATNAKATSEATVVTVKPSPTLNAMMVTATTCFGEAVEFDVAGLLPNVTNTIFYDLTLNGVTTTTGHQEVTSDNFGIAKFYIPDYAPGSYTFKLTSIVFGDCTTALTDKTVQFEVNAILTPSVNIAITSGSNPTCSGSAVVFTATPTNGGTPSFIWKKNSSNVGTGSTYTDDGTTAGSITVVMTSTLSCVTNPTATSNVVNMIVNPELPVSVSIVASQNPVCPNTRVEFTATPVNGGANPAYQWKVNGLEAGTSNVLFAYYPANDEVITCVLTSNAVCQSGSPATSEKITMSVGSVVLSSVSLSADPSGAVCEGTSVTFTAIPEGGGDSPKYFWSKNDIGLGEESASYSYVPANGDKIQVGMLSNSPCAAPVMQYSEPITVTVNPKLQVSVTVSASSNEVCEGTPVTYKAIPVNEGTSPKYHWLVNGAEKGTNNIELTYTPTDGDMVKVVMTSTATCATGNPATSGTVNMVINSNGQWLGITSDWDIESNWCGGVPTSSTNVSIPSGVTQPVIGVSTSASCNNIAIAYGATLTIASDATGTGSLIVSGSVSGEGSAAVQRYMTTDAWHIVASPVSGQSIAGFLASNPNVAEDVVDASIRGMMDYDPAINDWKAYFTNSTGGDLETGKGFSMRTDANSAVTFTGTLQSGNLSASGLAPALWNCVGNPYTSAIGINESSVSSANFLTANVSQLDPSFGAIYVWHNGDENNGIWGNYTIISNTPDFGSNADFDVQQGQAYMVKMNTAATTVSYTRDMQIHNPGLELKSTKGIWSIVKLNASIRNQNSSTTIAFKNGMTKGLDPTYDAGLLRGGSDLVLYSKLVEDNGIPFAIQALPGDEFSNLIIPIGIESKTGGELVFSSENMNLPATCQIILEDKVSKIFTDLSINEYVTTIEANTNVSDRFRIHTSTLTTKLGNGSLLGNLSAYAIRNVEIRVKGEVSKQAVATLYDLQGRAVLVKTLEEGSLNIIQTPNIKTAVYMLSIQDNGKTVRFKIPVNE